MRARRWLAFVLILTLLTGCRGGPAAPKTTPVQPVLFFYRTAHTGFSDETGLICPEERDLGDRVYTPMELFTLYFQGPQREDLVSPIPSGTELLSVDRSGSLLVIRLQQNAGTQSGIDLSILDACLAKTALQLEGVRQVRIRAESRGGQLLRDTTLSDSDMLLYDTGEALETTELTLYFADTAGRFLLTEKRTFPSMEAAQLPELVLEQLLLGPETPGMVSPLPQGTALLDVNVENGVCSVDFNADFYLNRPLDQRGEQLALLSVVNTLCELKDINQVQFYVEGSRLSAYTYLSLSESFTMDSSVVGPIREELNEFEGVLYLPGMTDTVLHSFPVRVRLRGNVSQEMALLQALYTRSEQNGLRNPLEGRSQPLSVTTVGLLCQVELAPDCLDGMSSAQVEEALRSMTATLSSISGIYRVSFRINGETVGPSPMSTKPDWFFENAE